MNMRLRLDTIIELLPGRLQADRPGLSAQLRLSPIPPPSALTYHEARDSCLKAAVLILIYPKAAEPHLVFIRRTSLGHHHQNQISFPGGGMKPGESLVESAFREAREELAVNTDRLFVAGELTPLYVQPSNYCIFPVIAISLEKMEFRPCPLEVEAVIEVPLTHLLNEENLKQEFWQLRGREILVPFYLYGEHKIWGATAMILSELLDILKKIEKADRTTSS